MGMHSPFRGDFQILLPVEAFALSGDAHTKRIVVRLEVETSPLVPVLGQRQSALDFAFQAAFNDNSFRRR